MVLGLAFVVIGCVWRVAHSQIQYAYPVKFTHDLDVFDASKHHKLHFPTKFAGGHKHPVLMRMKHRNFKHHLPDRILNEGNIIKRDNIFGNFDPNKFNSQIGANFNPNAFNGGSGSTSTGGTSMFNPNAMMGGGTGTGSMFNPNAMMGGGGQQGQNPGGSTGQSQQQQPGGTSQTGTGSGTSSPSFNPNNPVGGSSGQTAMFNPNAMMGGGGQQGQTPGGSTGQQQQSGGTSQTGTGSGQTGTGSPSSSGGGSTSGGTMPHYDPNNVINTGAKYDPNAANSGMGAASGGSAPSFSNGMGLNAHQQVPQGAANWAGSTPPPSGSGSQSSGSSSSGSSAANAFGSSSSTGGSSGSPSSGTGSGSAASFGSSGGSQSQTGSQSQSQTGSGSSSSSGSTSPGSGGPSFDPIKANAQGTAGFNPLNPMIGKDMTQLMGPQSQTGAKGPGNFDPGAVNTNMGKTGMSLNMFGGSGGNTNLNKADASSLMGGAQGMMAGSTAINSGGSKVLSGGSQTGGSGSGFGQTGGSSTSGSSGVNFDPNAMMGGGSSGGSSSSGSSMFNPSGMMGGGSGGSSSASGSGGMSMFDPNAMLGGGSVNPMSPGGNMNPMMPGASMTGSGSSSSRNAGSSSVLDPMGAMSGNARNFSGGASLIDPMGFMNGGGLSGSMTNMFGVSPKGRSVPMVGPDRQRRDTPQLNWRHGNFFNSATGQAYNPMDPMGFIFAGNNKQYTKGNGKDTPSYDPDKYSYSYAGMTLGSFPVMPSTGGAFIPSYQSPGTNLMNPEESKPATASNSSTTTFKTNPETTPSDQSSNSGGIMESFQKMMSKTNMYMFPHAVYNGVPGMLGVGFQRQMAPEAISSPSQVSQLMSQSFGNLTEIQLPHPSYSGLPGMKGEGTQTQGSISSVDIAGLEYGHMNSSVSANPKVEYSGVPGMLGTGSMTGIPIVGEGRAMQTFGDSGKNKTQGHSNSETYSQGFNFVAASGHTPTGESSSYGMGVPQQTGVNSWNGDWPGEISHGGTANRNQDWSGAWEDSWPKTGQHEDKTPSKEQTHEGSTSDFGNSGSSKPDPATTWDGSWPGQNSEGQSNSEETSLHQHAGSHDHSESTIEALKDLIAHLNDFPTNIKDSHEESSHSSSYTALVGNWNKELKNNR